MFKQSMYAAAAALVLLGLGLAPTPSWALGLGSFQLKSGLGELLQGEIEVSTADAKEADSVVVRPLASSEYAREGLEFAASLATLQVRIERRGSTVVAVLTTAMPVREPSFAFVLDGEAGLGRVRRTYRVSFGSPDFLKFGARADVERAASAASAPATKLADAPPILYTHLTQVGRAPAKVSPFSGQAVEQSVARALFSVVPRGWRGLAADTGVRNAGTVTWAAVEQPWPQALDSILAQTGLFATVDWDRKEVTFRGLDASRIVPRDAATASLTPGGAPAGSASATPGAAQSVSADLRLASAVRPVMRTAPPEPNAMAEQPAGPARRTSDVALMVAGANVGAVTPALASRAPAGMSAQPASVAALPAPNPALAGMGPGLAESIGSRALVSLPPPASVVSAPAPASVNGNSARGDEVSARVASAPIRLPMTGAASSSATVEVSGSAPSDTQRRARAEAMAGPSIASIGFNVPVMSALQQIAPPGWMVYSADPAVGAAPNVGWRGEGRGWHAVLEEIVGTSGLDASFDYVKKEIRIASRGSARS